MHAVNAQRPWLEPEASRSRDSDGISVMFTGVAAGFVLGGAVGLSAGGGLRRTSDGVRTTRVSEGRAAATWAPTTTTRVDVESGFAVTPGETTTVVLPPVDLGQTPTPSVATLVGSTRLFPMGRLRFQWRDAESRGRLDLRATHALLAASPRLVQNQVQRSEVGGEGELRVAGPVAIRGLARVASIRSTVDDNSRATFGARLVGRLPGGGEITVGGQQFTYAHASTAGYSAPQQTRIVEVGVYRELETERGVSFAVDLGAGGQQVTEWGAPVSPWAPALRGWASFGIPLAPGRELRFEAEGYDARIGSELATGGARWRYGSGAVSLRWAF
jgi:hypothetical protein